MTEPDTNATHVTAPVSRADVRRAYGDTGEPLRDLNAPEPEPQPNDSPPIWDLVIADMRARDLEGRRKYGVPLQAGNGRDPLVDAYQEALDLAVYLRQAIEERRGAAGLAGAVWERWEHDPSRPALRLANGQLFVPADLACSGLDAGGRGARPGAAVVWDELQADGEHPHRSEPGLGQMSESEPAEPRMLPALPERAETGPMQFGDDWPGVFIRGDNAAYYALHLESAVKLLPPTATLDRAVLEGLLGVLGGRKVRVCGKPQPDDPRYAWRLTAGEDGSFDEIVVGKPGASWIHLECMGEDDGDGGAVFWWARVGDARLWIEVPVDGEPKLTVDMGFYAERGAQRGDGGV